MKPFDSEHVTFAIFMSESRRFFEEYNRGWHLGDNVGMMAFDMSKPCIENWKLKFGNCYCKGLRHDDRPVRELRIPVRRAMAAGGLLR